MAVIYRLDAQCDGRRKDQLTKTMDLGQCVARRVLDPDRNRPFVELLEAGWSTEVVGHDQLVFCPEHTKERGDG